MKGRLVKGIRKLYYVDNFPVSLQLSQHTKFSKYLKENKSTQTLRVLRHHFSRQGRHVVILLELTTHSWSRPSLSPQGSKGLQGDW